MQKNRNGFVLHPSLSPMDGVRRDGASYTMKYEILVRRPDNKHPFILVNVYDRGMCAPMMHGGSDKLNKVVRRTCVSTRNKNYDILDRYIYEIYQRARFEGLCKDNPTKRQNLEFRHPYFLSPPDLDIKLCRARNLGRRQREITINQRDTHHQLYSPRIVNTMAGEPLETRCELHNRCRGVDGSSQ